MRKLIEKSAKNSELAPAPSATHFEEPKEKWKAFLADRKNKAINVTRKNTSKTVKGF